MYTFGNASNQRLSTCRNELRIVAQEALKYADFSIVYGTRTETEQAILYQQGFSKVQYPNSKHNKNPSDAFDFVPYPVDWKDERQFTYIAGLILGIGLSKGIILRWGGDWKQNGKLKENTFNDLGHIEFVRNLNDSENNTGEKET